MNGISVIELFRTRDVIVFFKGSTFPVTPDAALLSAGWAGGQGVQWATSPVDNFMVTQSDGRLGGFLLWGSNEASDQYTAYSKQQIAAGYGVLCTGTWIISTTSFEKYTWLSRQGPGPLVPNTFISGSRLRFSLRGLWTPEDEYALSGSPMAPNNNYAASVCQPPGSYNQNYLTLQTFI